MASRKVSNRFIEERILDGKPCYKFEEIPAYPDSGYSELLQWVDQEILPRKTEYYDRKGKLLKTLVISDCQKYRGSYWRLSKMVMENHQTGRGTELLWSEY